MIEIKIVAPDSSDWANWLDGMSSRKASQKSKSLALHDKMMSKGAIPYISFHHIQELLSIGNPEVAEARMHRLRGMEMLAWGRAISTTGSTGTIVDLLASECIAYTEGLRDLLSIRARARKISLQTGPGDDALSGIFDAWKVIREDQIRSRPKSDLTAVSVGLSKLPRSMTVHDFCNTRRASPSSVESNLKSAERDQYLALLNSGSTEEDASALSREFIEAVRGCLPTNPSSGMDLLLRSLVPRGIRESEIEGRKKIGDLLDLSEFRMRLRVAAGSVGLNELLLYDANPDLFPSQVVERSLRRHGQDRSKRPGSDVYDGYLSALAAYCQKIFVDKRTSEDFRRAIAKDRNTRMLVGEVEKGGNFERFYRSLIAD